MMNYDGIVTLFHLSKHIHVCYLLQTCTCVELIHSGRANVHGRLQKS